MHSAFGINFNLSTMHEVVESVNKNIEEDEKLNIVVVNAAVLVACFQDKNFLNTVNSADIITVDGMPLLWALKLLGYNITEKVSGPDLFRQLLTLSSDKGYSVYFLGAEKEILQRMVLNLQNMFPKLKISGYRNGFFKKEEEEMIVNDINNSTTNMLFLGLPSPTKEKFSDNPNIKTNVVMGVGGVFDIEAGLVKRAPVWMQNNGLEWFYRLIQEPRRLWKRYFITNTIFIYIVLKEIIHKWRNN